MLLKLALGPVFGVIGVLVLQAKIIPNVRFPMPLADLLIWAVVFGAAQQALTRIIDNRVAGLVSDTPVRQQPARGSRGSGDGAVPAGGSASPAAP